MAITTLDLLIRQFGGRTIVPLGEVASAYLGLSAAEADKQSAKLLLGFRADRLRNSQKAPRMVVLTDFARYIDNRRNDPYCWHSDG